MTAGARVSAPGVAARATGYCPTLSSPESRTTIVYVPPAATLVSVTIAAAAPVFVPRRAPLGPNTSIAGANAVAPSSLARIVALPPAARGNVYASRSPAGLDAEVDCPDVS